MKKYFLILFAMSNTVLAMQTLNINTDTVSCNGVIMNKHMTESNIMKTCKSAQKTTKDDVVASHDDDRVRGSNIDEVQNDDVQNIDAQYDKIAFFDDKSRHIQCYFKNNKLVKCKFTISNQTTKLTNESSTK